MEVELAYGSTRLSVALPPADTTLITPRHSPGLADEEAAFREALRAPIGSPPLREIIAPSDRVVIVFSDITRPVPNERILPWLLAELAYLPRQNITLLVATGTHRPNSQEDLVQMVGEEIVASYRIVNHDCNDKSSLTYLGQTSRGSPVWINSLYLAADRKILTGFIEPHLFVGFSGGPKAVLPGVAGLQSIMHNHSGRMLSHPKATWGVLRGNPAYEEILEVARLAPPDFTVNVTTNRNRAITGIFCGEMEAAHAAGVEACRASATQPVEAPFDIVLTTNSGYPLDLNLYQAIKGMATAAQIVKGGGAIVLAAECREGIPEHGHYREILHMCRNIHEVLELVRRPDFHLPDQWQAQIQAQIQLKAQVFVYSILPEEEVRKAHLTPIASIEKTIAELLSRYGPGARLAVLPEGPQTIPYLANR